MANPKTKYDTEEVDEILRLYEKTQRKKGKMITNLKPKSVSNFNVEIVEQGLKRNNGEPFTLYKYNFWAGRQPNGGDYNYGKKKIMQLNEELVAKLAGQDKDIEIQDIISIIEKNHKNPNKLTELICHYVKKQKNKTKALLEENIKLTEESRNLKIQNARLQDGFTTIMFNSQIPNNSLNDMLSLQKTQDKFISDELEMMFEDGVSRFESLIDVSNRFNSSNDVNTLQNIISFEENKVKELRRKQLEEEGF